MSDNEQELQSGQESPEQKKDKVTKKYNTAMETLKKIIGGEKNLTPVKSVGGDPLAGVVADLFKEEREALLLQVKDGLKGLLKLHVGNMGDIAKKRKELDSLEQQKKEEFTKAANNFFQLIDRQSVSTEEYAQVLLEAMTGEKEKDTPAATTPEDTEPQS